MDLRKSKHKQGVQIDTISTVLDEDDLNFFFSDNGRVGGSRSNTDLCAYARRVLQQVLNDKGVIESIDPHHEEENRISLTDKFFLFRVGGSKVENINNDAVLQFLSDRARDDNDQTSKFWLHIVSPTVNEIESLDQFFSLDILTIDDVTSMNIDIVQEKVLVFPNYIHIVVRELLSNQQTSSGLDSHPLHLLVFANFIITIQPEMTLVETLVLTEQNYKKYGLRQPKIEREKQYHLIDNVKLAFQMLIRSSNNDDPFDDDLTPDLLLIIILCCNFPFFLKTSLFAEIEADALDELVISFARKSSANARDLLQRLRVASSRIMFLYWFVLAKSITLEKVQSVWLSSSLLSRELRPYFRMICNVVGKLKYQLQVSKEKVADNTETFLNMASIVDARSSEKSGRISKRLTAVVTISAPLTLVIAWFGMNVPIPSGMSAGADNRHVFFWAIVVAQVVVIFGTLLLMHYRRWFD
jgi:Mg2+ and Co2+ transporter CorA